jgi:hypothetical protein
MAFSQGSNDQSNLILRLLALTTSPYLKWNFDVVPAPVQIDLLWKKSG